MDDDQRRRERNRLAQAEARRRARETGEPMGHGLDALLVDGMQLMLEGRDLDDPVRSAWMKAMARAIRARRHQPTPALARRLQARLTVSSSLQDAVCRARADGVAGV